MQNIFFRSLALFVPMRALVAVIICCAPVELYAATFKVSGALGPFINGFFETGTNQYFIDKADPGSFTDFTGEWRVTAGLQYSSGQLIPPTEDGHFTAVSFDGSYFESTMPITLRVGAEDFGFYYLDVSEFRIDIESLAFEGSYYREFPSIMNPWFLDDDYGRSATVSGRVSSCRSDNDRDYPCTQQILTSVESLFGQYSIGASSLVFGDAFNSFEFSNGINFDMDSTSQVGLTAHLLGFYDPQGECIAASGCNPALASVPLPASIWLLLTALGGLMNLKKC